MRWKLVLIASLLATIAGAGATLGLVLGFSGSAAKIKTPDLFVIGTFLAPVAATTFASIFVYRHTSRRRRLQAMLTALLAILLTLTILLIGSMFTTERTPAPNPTPSPREIS